MRVLSVTNTYPPGDISGVGALVYELTRALAAAGHEPWVLTRQAGPADRFAITVGGPKLLFPLFAALRFARLAARPGFDLVHVHESDGALVALWLRACRALRLGDGRARLVATLQVSYRRERLAVRPVSSGLRVVSHPTGSERIFALLRAPILALLGRLSARLADAVVAPSRGTARELEEDYRATVAAVIANGVALPEAGDAAAGEPLPGIGRPVVLYAGRLRTRKAVAVLVEAFAAVLEELPAASLVLLGDGEQRSALESQARTLGIAGAVRFAGALPRAATADFYARAEIFCLPSTYEGFPVAILEAMAHALPVVSTRVAGIPEAVEDGVTGRIVEPEDASGLARALIALGRDPALARKMGEAGRARVETLFRSDRVAAAYLALYRAEIDRAR